MTDATVAPLARFACTASMTPPVITAGGLLLGTQAGLQSYMPNPWAQGDITWQGAEFGFAAPGSPGAQVQRIEFQLKHRISALAAFTSATAQVYDGATPVGAPFPLTLSIDYVTDTFYLYSGYPAADLPALALQVTYHSVAPGLAYVNSVYVQAAYSFASAITPFSIACTTAMPAPVPAVTLPWVNLVRLGQQVFTLAPSFGQPTASGNMLLGWAFSNSGSPTFDTTCSDPSWTLAGHGGAAFAWLSLWYKLNCGAGETAPSFTTPASVPMSQLAEFTGAKALDQFGSAAGTSSYAVTAGGADTRSGDLVVAVYAWSGANAGPAVISLAGEDSAGHALLLAPAGNPAYTGSQFWTFGWGQAGQAFAPLADTATGTLNLFEGSAAVLASFTPAGLPQPPLPVPSRLMGGRVVTIPVRAG